MILGGTWYYKVEGVRGINFSYRLLTNDGPTYIYFHLVVKSKITMLPCVLNRKVIQCSQWLLKLRIVW
jgi:hypothetical protein